MPDQFMTKYNQQHLFIWYGEIHYEKRYCEYHLLTYNTCPEKGFWGEFKLQSSEIDKCQSTLQQAFKSQGL